MDIKLDYTILDIDERMKIVENICEENKDNLTPKNLETLSNYLINCVEKEERKKRKILTQNRMATVNKRETSLEGLVSKFENGEDGVYQLFNPSSKNYLLSPSVSITKKDIEELPFIKQIREAIESYKKIEKKINDIGLKLNYCPTKHLGTDGTLDVMKNLYEYLKKKDIEFIFNEEVVTINNATDSNEKAVVCKSGEVYFTKKII